MTKTRQSQRTPKGHTGSAVENKMKKLDMAAHGLHRDTPCSLPAAVFLQYSAYPPILLSHAGKKEVNSLCKSSVEQPRSPAYREAVYSAPEPPSVHAALWLWSSAMRR